MVNNHVRDKKLDLEKLTGNFIHLIHANDQMFFSSATDSMIMNEIKMNANIKKTTSRMHF
jgi:hypothetical protein